MLQPEVSKLRAIVDFELSKLGTTIGNFGLSEQMNYAVLSLGKRLRPILTLLSSLSVGGNLDQTVNLAMGFELMHAASLVHDDVLDNDNVRRGEPALYKKWSVGEAILVGDALLSLALNLVSDYDRVILKVFAETGMKIAEGEHSDFMISHIFSEDEYLKRIKRKSAALFQASTKCGAIAGNGSEKEIIALANFGEDFGNAFQIRDDILDLTDEFAFEGQIPSDLKQRRLTLPIIHLLNSLSETKKNHVLNLIETFASEDSSKNSTSYKNLMEELNKNGSLNYCKTKVNSYVNSAIKHIQPINNTVFKTNLIEIARSLMF